VLLVVPQYSLLDMEPLKSLIFNLEIEKKVQKEFLSSVFGLERTCFGYSNWGSHDIGFDDPLDQHYFNLKQGTSLTLPSLSPSLCVSLYPLSSLFLSLTLSLSLSLVLLS
jgi:hypothetical protein